LEIEDGLGGDFVPLYGDIANTMTLSYIYSMNILKG
jgi:hypothetical protein